MGNLLDKQYQFYLQNLPILLDKYEGRFVVIHDQKVVDTFDSERDAYVYCVQNLQIGTFFIREVTAESAKEA